MFLLRVRLTTSCRPPSRVKAAALFLALSFSLSAVAAAAQGDYIGSKGCSDCHGAIWAGWQGTKHARAFTELEKTGQENLSACVPCPAMDHVRSGFLFRLSMQSDRFQPSPKWPESRQFVRSKSVDSLPYVAS